MVARGGVNQNRRDLVVSGILLAAALVLGPSLAAAQGMPDPAGQSPTGLIDSLTGAVGVPASRNAVSALQGVAALYTPLCPAAVLVTVISPNSDTCTVTATGYDYVRLQIDPSTGQVTPIGGPVFGTYQVVVQLDNPVDSPELPVLTGAFYGTITFGQAGTPIGNATGFFVPGGQVSDAQACTAASATCLPFTATFRQPFAMGATGQRAKPKRAQQAFYLLDDGQLQPVRRDERAVGWPTVRFEVNFSL
jgi:hypothetical protein